MSQKALRVDIGGLRLPLERRDVVEATRFVRLAVGDS